MLGPSLKRPPQAIYGGRLAIDVQPLNALPASAAIQIDLLQQSKDFLCDSAQKSNRLNLIYLQVQTTLAFAFATHVPLHHNNGTQHTSNAGDAMKMPVYHIHEGDCISMKNDILAVVITIEQRTDERWALKLQDCFTDSFFNMVVPHSTLFEIVD